jgi:lipopolysaccharide transport system permease protein
VGNAQLVSKVFFPRLILPLSTVLSTLLDFAVSFALLVVMMVMYGVTPGWGIVLLPAWVALLTLYALGLGFYASALMVRYRDLQYVVPVLLQVLLYACPVAYSLSAVPPNLRTLYLINPLSSVLDAFRGTLLGGADPHWLSLAYSAGFGLALFVFGAFSFKKMEKGLADVI